MLEIELRPTVATDLPRLIGLDHTVKSDSVWQLELRKEGGQVASIFREVRLPRTINVAYPHDPYNLPDDWVRKSMMFTAMLGKDPAGYICLLEQGTASVVTITDLVVDSASRRKGVGAALLAAGQEWAASRSHRRLILEMQAKNLPAIRLAQKFGYEFCGYNDHYYVNQDVAIFFAKILK